MATYNPALQRAHLADASPDVHGRIIKRTAELDGVSVTEVTFGVGARWSEDLKGLFPVEGVDGGRLERGGVGASVPG